MIPLVRLITRNKRQSILIVYLLSTALIYFYWSLGIYNFEKGTNANLKNYPDALWMSFVTLTSVGYGDIYPVTGGGRIMAVILVITGLGLFSLVTAEIATILIKYLREESDESEL